MSKTIISNTQGCVLTVVKIQHMKIVSM